MPISYFVWSLRTQTTYFVRLDKRHWNCQYLYSVGPYYMHTYISYLEQWIRATYFVPNIYTSFGTYFVPITYSLCYLKTQPTYFVPLDKIINIYLFHAHIRCLFNLLSEFIYFLHIKQYWLLAPHPRYSIPHLLIVCPLNTLFDHSELKLLILFPPNITHWKYQYLLILSPYSMHTYTTYFVPVEQYWLFASHPTYSIPYIVPMRFFVWSFCTQTNGRFKKTL